MQAPIQRCHPRGQTRPASWRALLRCLGIALALLACSACASAASAAAPGRTAPATHDDDATQLRMAVAVAPTGVPLEDILSGRARIGFDPVLAGGAPAVLHPGESMWLRLRTRIPDDGAARVLVLPRQQIQRLRLVQPGPPELVVAESGLASRPASRWPDRFVLPVEGSGVRTLYVELQGEGWLNIRPSLQAMDAATEAGRGADHAFDLLYGVLFLLGVLAVARRWFGERTLRVAAAAFACLGAGLVSNHHLQLSLGGASLASLPALVPALWFAACATLLWATTQYAGLEKNFPEVARLLDRAGFALLGLALLLPLLTPSSWLGGLQVVGLGVMIATALACAGALMFDHRQWRWVAALLWFVVAGTLVLPVLALQQLVPDTLWTRRGFQFAIAAQLANYLLLPWGRQWLLARAARRRDGGPEPTAEEKIAHARDWMISSLQTGIETGADGDMEWIAYRRLMGGLKSVLPQTGAAVIAMNYHNEDLMLAEPKSAEPRFQALLAQRGSLLKNLSRSMGPQQIGVDFLGPDGPVQQALLAVIPLPIERPGWGLLVIERSPQVSYSDDELALGTEFAALATTAGDEAAEAMQKRRAKEIDPESGVYRGEMLEPLMKAALALSQQKRRPLSLMRIAVDQYDALSPDLAAESIRIVADIVRDEIEFGESIGRAGADGLVVLLPGRMLGESRALGDRLCAAVRKLALPVTEEKNLSISIGLSQMQPGERGAELVVERAARALAKSRKYGGNQVQAIVSTNV